MSKRFASFYRCLAFARFWKVKSWRSCIKCQYFNDGWTDFHKNIYLYKIIELELKYKGGALLSSSRLELLEYSEQPYLCAMRFNWCEFMGIKSLQIVCKYTYDLSSTFVLGIFSNTGKTHIGSKWWPGNLDVKDDPNDPMTRWPNDPVPCLRYTVSYNMLSSNGLWSEVM